MADKFPCGKLKAIRIILAMVQNGTDLCFCMQGYNRDIRFNIFVFVAEESFCLQVPEQQLRWKKKKEPVRAGLWRIVQGWNPGFLSHLCHRLTVTVILPGSDSLYPPSRPGWLTSKPFLPPNASPHSALTPSQSSQAIIRVSTENPPCQDSWEAWWEIKSFNRGSSFIRIQIRGLFPACFPQLMHKAALNR